MEAAHVRHPHIDDQGSRPIVRGTDLKVSQIASEYEHLGMTPDDIVEAHPHLTLADVHAAMAYYYDHQEQIRADWHETDALIAVLEKSHPGRMRPDTAS